MSKLKFVEFDNFTLKKAKVSTQKVEIEFEERFVADDNPHIRKHIIKSDIMPHPDLTNKINDLKGYLAKAYHYEKLYNAGRKLKKTEDENFTNEYLDILNQIEVMGISIGGNDNLRGVVISGKMESNNGAKVAMNTPRIVFESEKLGYESEVEEKIIDISEEIYAYLFENKKANKELFDEISNDKGEIPKAVDVAGSGLQ